MRARRTLRIGSPCSPAGGLRALFPAARARIAARTSGRQPSGVVIGRWYQPRSHTGPDFPPGIAAAPRVAVGGLERAVSKESPKGFHIRGPTMVAELDSPGTSHASQRMGASASHTPDDLVNHGIGKAPMGDVLPGQVHPAQHWALPVTGPWNALDPAPQELRERLRNIQQINRAALPHDSHLQVFSPPGKMLELQPRKLASANTCDRQKRDDKCVSYIPGLV